MATEEKPSRNEDEYFVRMDAELMKARRARLDEEREKRDRAVHLGKCPRCGCDLAETEAARGNVKIDRCPECKGIWLDAGELEQIRDMDRDGLGLLGTLFSFRK